MARAARAETMRARSTTAATGPTRARSAASARPTFALYRTSIRRALGIRRSWRQKVLPWTLLAIVTVPAIVNVGVGYVTRNTPAEGFKFITYQEYVGVSSALLLFVAVTAPDVVCPDRRHRVLPLIFARPLVGRDYVLAKVGAIATILFGFSFLPQVVLFVGQMLVSDAALDYLRDNADVLWKVPVAVVLLAVYYAAIGVAVASLTSRRIVGGVALLALALVPVRALGRGAEQRRRRTRADRAHQPPGPPPLPPRHRLHRPHRRDEPARRRLRRRPAGRADLPRRRAGSDGPPPACATGSPTRDRHRPLAPGRSGLRRRTHGRGRRPLGLVRPQGRPVRAELLVRARRHRPPRSQRCGQDDADAGHHRPPRPQRRHRAGRRAQPPDRPRGAPRPGAGARGRGGARGADGPAAGPLRRPAPRRERPGRRRRRAGDRRPAGRRRPSGPRLQQGHAPADEGRRRPRHERRASSSSTSR